MTHSCEICSATSEGRHFGVWCCRACAAFYRRWLVHREPLFCTANQNCDLTDGEKKLCRACRLKKCQEVGMRNSLPVSITNPVITCERSEKSLRKTLTASDQTWVQNFDGSVAGRSITGESDVARTSETRKEAEIFPIIPNDFNSKLGPQLRRVNAAFIQLQGWRRGVKKVESSEEFGKRKLFETEDRAPQAMTYYTSLLQYKRDITLLADFARAVSEEFTALEKEQKSTIFKHFVTIFCCAECAYFTFKSGQSRVVIHPSGDFYDATQKQTWEQQLANVPVDFFVEVSTPLQIEFFTKIVSKFHELSMDVVDFLTLTVFLLWPNGVEGISDETEEIAKRARLAAVKEYISYCTSCNISESECAMRLSKLILLIPLIQRFVVRMQATFEFATMLGWHTLDEDIQRMCLATY